VSTSARQTPRCPPFRRCYQVVQQARQARRRQPRLRGVRPIAGTTTTTVEGNAVPPRAREPTARRRNTLLRARPGGTHHGRLLHPSSHLAHCQRYRRMHNTFSSKGVRNVCSRRRERYGAPTCFPKPTSDGERSAEGGNVVAHDRHMTMQGPVVAPVRVGRAAFFSIDTAHLF